MNKNSIEKINELIPDKINMVGIETLKSIEKYLAQQQKTDSRNLAAVRKELKSRQKRIKS